VFGLSGISALMLLLKRMACIVGFTDEFLKRPGVESYVGTRLRRALVRGFNYVSLDPASAVSVLASTPEVVSGGADAESVLSDVETMLSYLSGTLSGAALFASPRTCAALALTRGTDGQLAFPGVTVKGGTLAGFSLLSALGLTDGILGVVDGNSVLFASEPVELARASSGTLEMSTTPASEIRTPTSMALSHAPVSLFQTDSSAIRATWPVAWAVRGAETVAAAYISGLPALPQPSA
jgi:hypothetical protein